MTVQNLIEVYREIAREIHLAVRSGDDTARSGVQGMIERRDQLAQELKDMGIDVTHIQDEIIAE